MIWRRRRRGRPPKSQRKREVIIRLGVLLLLVVITGGLLFKFGVITRQRMVGMGKGVLGAISSVEVVEDDRWDVRLQKTLGKLWEEAKGSILEGVKQSLKKPEEGNEKVKFAVVADSHEDIRYFSKILSKAKDLDVDFLIHLGDFSNGGNLDKLFEAKRFLNASGVKYYVIPGDHDYNWVPDHNLRNFKQVFSNETYQSFVYQGVYFILLDNSDHELGLGERQELWLERELQSAVQLPSELILVFTHIPLYNELFPNKVMGSNSSGEEVDRQRRKLLGLFEDFEVDYVFSGDVHYFSQYFEPESRLKMVTAGAACGEKCKNFLPQFVLVTVYKDGRIEIIPKPYKELEDVKK